MAAKPTRGIIYLRVSTDEQAKSGAGIGSQRDACGAYAAQHAIHVVSSHADEGISGATSWKSRPGLRAALAQLAPGDVLIVARRDRIARDTMVVGEIDLTLAGLGCRLVSVAGEGTEGDDSNAIMLRKIIDVINENVRLVIKERTRAALANRRAASRSSGQLPYGVRLTGGGPESKSGRPSSIEDDDRDLEAFALIGELDAIGWSTRAIAAHLTDLGFPTKNPHHKRSTGKWGHSTVRRLAARWRAAQAAGWPPEPAPLPPT